jgi:hypothetical protein
MLLKLEKGVAPQRLGLLRAMLNIRSGRLGESLEPNAEGRQEGVGRMEGKSR